MSTNFTVLLPVYNGEKFIKRAVLSVINQEYEDYKLYIINDGSTDRTLSICEELAKKNNKIEIVSTPNGGLASARNVGVGLASARDLNTKIIWIDADDELEANLFIKLDKTFRENSECDAIFYNYNLIVDDRIVENRYISQRFGIEGLISRDILLKKILIGDINNYMWAFAADASVYRDIVYPEGKKYEDLGTLYKIVKNINKAFILDIKGYRYYIDNPDSLSKNFTAKDAWSLLDIIEEVSIVLKEFDRNYTAVFQAIYMINIIISLANNKDCESLNAIEKTRGQFNKIKKYLHYDIYKNSRYSWKIILMKHNMILPIYRIKGGIV